jgi:hypothetical protein
MATIINAGPGVATDCRILPLTGIPATFFYVALDAGWDFDPIDIPPGAAHRFSFGFIPHAPIAQTEVQLSFACSNTSPAPIFPGVNTFLLSASPTPVADIVAMASTSTNDGIMGIGTLAAHSTWVGAFAVATTNVGADDTLTVSADSGTELLPVSVSICQTDPKTSACLSPPQDTVTTTIRFLETPTFGIFVTATTGVGLSPAWNRIFVRFRDGGGVTRGSTSVAVWTPDYPWDYWW